jgi:hypothetical protein
MALLAGCIKKPIDTGEHTHFETVETDACLAIVVDLSGSFHNDWQQDGRAHRLFMDLITQFFNEGLGQESRVVLGQISHSDDFVLFEGTPNELTRRFRTPESLNDFLQQHADPQSSKVYRSTRGMLDHLAGMNGTTSNTRRLVVVLSDMHDSESSLEEWRKAGNEMFLALQSYADSGGGLALYFVAEDQKQLWSDLLEQAGFSQGSYVIEGQLSESPQLPSFQ